MAVTGSSASKRRIQKSRFSRVGLARVELDRRGCGTRRSGADRPQLRDPGLGNAVRDGSGSYGRQNDNRRWWRGAGQSESVDLLCQYLLDSEMGVAHGRGQPKPVRALLEGVRILAPDILRRKLHIHMVV